MSQPATLHGPRVTLRPWRLPADLDPVAAINADPAVMRFFPAPMTRAESDAWCARIAGHVGTHGWGFWVVEHGGQVAGVVGLQHVAFEARFTPAVEIGWRIAPAFQRQGLAEEAARIALAHGFGRLNLPEVVAFTPPANEPSWRLMEKLGMARDGTFDHPRLPEGHPLRTHLLYRITRPAWIADRIPT